MIGNPLFDERFLKALIEQPVHIKHARLTALDNNEHPLEVIQGRLTGSGTVQLDGKSSQRRTCNGLNVVVDDPSITEGYWVYKTKFKLEIGIENHIDSNYPDIIWFKQGVFLIASFSVTQNTNNLTVSITGKDKLAQLDGTMGGTLTAEYNFGEYEQVTADMIQTKKITISTIIRQAIGLYAQEPAHNIIINDLDDFGYELWKYQGGTSDKKENSLYYFLDVVTQRIHSMELDDTVQVYDQTTNENIRLKDIPIESFYQRNTMADDDSHIFQKKSGGNNYKIIKISYGEVAGYHKTDLVYPGDLILKAGNPITSLLDKIVGMLGEYEYFYDIDGRFVFQKKKNYIQGLFSPLVGEAAYSFVTDDQYTFKFNDNKLITSLATTPKLDLIKNDFVVWGATNSKLPIHARFAIDKKPTKYTTLDRYTPIKIRYIEFIKTPFTSEMIKNGVKAYNTTNGVQWSEVTANSGVEYFRKTYEGLTPLNQGTATSGTHLKFKAVCEIQEDGKELYIRIDADTQYYEFDPSRQSYELKQIDNILRLDENYYKKDTAISNKLYTAEDYDWRELIYQMALDHQLHNSKMNFAHTIATTNGENLNRYDGKTGYEQYYTDLLAFWRQLYDPNSTDDEKYILDYESVYYHWNRDAVYSPESLIFWFDFLDTAGDISKYSVPAIGDRIKTDDGKATSIYLKKSPEVEFVLPTDKEYSTNNNELALTKMQLNQYTQDLFSISSQGQAAMDRIDTLVYEHLCAGDAIKISCVPIYYLQPNTRIKVEGQDLDVNGDYIVTSVTIPLGHSGTMSISASKVAKYLK